jgi:hypothetical protein
VVDAVGAVVAIENAASAIPEDFSGYYLTGTSDSASETH